MKIKIGSRKSDLARIQAYAVGKVLTSLKEISSVEYVFKSSLGDQNQDDPLWQMPEKGVFTQDLTKDLEAGEVDLVVHSWKDLPVEDRESTRIAGTLPRADQRDLLLFRKDRLKEMMFTHSTRIFSSSPRRIYNLSEFLSWALPGGKVRVEFDNVRGNIQTRVNKLLESEEVDGLVVAKAAIDRILSSTEEEFKESWKSIRTALESCLIMVLPLKENPSAAGQGAIAMEIRRSDTSLGKLLEKISCAKTLSNVNSERQILKSYGGGCHQKIGVSCLSRDYGQILSLRGKTDDNEVLNQWTTNKKVTEEKLRVDAFPLEMKEARLFDDEDIEVDSSQLEMANSLYVSKWRALPENAELDLDQTVWTAGLRTWRKLAQRGIWVTGSSESLGEAESPRLESIKGPLKWLRLTHEGALSFSDSESVATYRLTKSHIPVDLLNKKYYFWTSYSSFKAAIEKMPQIRDRDHSCGPGKTAELIEAELERKPNIYLSYKEWMSEFK